MNHYKITYKCDCGCDYGSCGRRNFFLLEVNRSVDVYTLYHKHHADEPASRLKEVWCSGDAGMEALTKIINCEDSPEKYDKSDFDEIKQARGR